MMKKKGGFLVRLTLFFGITVFSINMFSTDFEVIKNPKPNMVEKQYVALKRIKTIDPDLGNGQYLFQPFSLTADKDSIYVYDLLQAKIFKFDPDFKVVKKSFGRNGINTGEFGGSGKEFPVFICVGRDGKLYAHDMKMKKIIIFDLDGKFLGEFKNIKTYLKAPLVDAAGNFFIAEVKDNVINFFNEKQSPLLTITNQKECFNYLFSLPPSSYLESVSKNQTRDLIISMASDSTLLIYFPTSSTMVMAKNNNIRKVKIWPQDALACYENDLKELLEKDINKYKYMFPRVLVDDANAEVFFLHFGINRMKGINTLYQLTGSGELLKVLYAKIEDPGSFLHFELKKRDLFYGIDDDQLIIYKEEIK